MKKVKLILSILSKVITALKDVHAAIEHHESMNKWEALKS